MVTGLAAALLALASSEPFVNVVHREMNLEADVGAAFAAACAPRFARMGGEQASSNGVSRTLEFSLVVFPTEVGGALGIGW